MTDAELTAARERLFANLTTYLGREMPADREDISTVMIALIDLESAHRHDQVMTLANLTTAYRDGDDLGWATEFTWLREHHKQALADLTRSIAVEGIREPILLGDDGRVWDGHHRLAVADTLGLRNIPVRRVGGDPS